MQRPSSLYLIEFAPDLGHAVPDQPAVGLDLRVAGAAEEAESAALPFEVGPAADQATGLIVEMRKLDLKATLRGGGALSENLQDKPSPIDHFRADLFFQVLLLDRVQRRVDYQEVRVFRLRRCGNLLNLALTEQRGRPHGAHAERLRGDDVDSDRFGKAFRLLDSGVGRTPSTLSREFGYRNDRALAASNLGLAMAVILVQDLSS